jgi:hypothetical protein
VANKSRVDGMLFKGLSKNQEPDSTRMVLAAEQVQSIIKGLKTLQDVLVKAGDSIADEVAEDVMTN